MVISVGCLKQRLQTVCVCKREREREREQVGINIKKKIYISHIAGLGRKEVFVLPARMFKKRLSLKFKNKK